MSMPALILVLLAGGALAWLAQRASDELPGDPPPPEPTAAPPAWQATWQTRALPGTFPDLPPGR